MAPTNQQARAAKAKVVSGGKAPKARVQRYLNSQESKIKEGAKSTVLLKGTKCSHAMGHVLKDLRAMLAPNAKLLAKKNQIFAFDSEGQMSLEFLTTKNDCALFAMASHNKKRPNNLVLGRTFDRQVLDMIEVGVTRFKSMEDYGGKVPKKRIGSKPLMLFLGDIWEQNDNTRRLQSFLVDFYRGDPVEKLVAQGLDHVMVFSLTEKMNPVTNTSVKTIHQRTYFMKLKKNPDGSSNTPVPFLTPCGPDLDMMVRRDQFASIDLWRAAMKQPAAAKKKKVKNQSTNMFGETIGRLHMNKQDIDKMQGRKSKALRRAEKMEAEEEKAAVERELESEQKQIGNEFKRDFGFENDN
ncbi:production factor 2 homolog [Seminavis robusta]|uniref:Ribosome production factor 2 homolog n=1 Tax=Seminavis robusta TaxID=568900 RepID=A0A9N8HH63_9STRA|nr:production factor 2 homolog [Seminavis robusta]|eukprot:Sro545_g163870.1 production factor 2 homolog (353) ;mRNA; r:31283-32432